jgi:hypothetical protein
MSADTWVTISQIAIFVGAVLAAGGGAGSWYFGRMVERQKEDASTSQQIVLDKKIESLIVGNSELARRLAPFEQIAEKIYPAADRDDALRKLASDVAGMRQQTQRLTQMTAPRRLSEDQRRILLRELQKLKGEIVDVSVPMGDTEAFALAEQFKAVFSQAGLDVNGVNQGIYSGPMPGLLITVPTEELTPKVNSFVQALRAASLEVSGNLDRSKSGNEIILVVGSKQ